MAKEKSINENDYFWLILSSGNPKKEGAIWDYSPIYVFINVVSFSSLKYNIPLLFTRFTRYIHVPMYGRCTVATSSFHFINYTFTIQMALVTRPFLNPSRS